jgi:ribosomal protein L37AE/L43A
MFSLTCAHCGTKGVARALKRVQRSVWLIDYQCDNVTCGHTYRARLAVTEPRPMKGREKKQGPT